MIASVKEPVAGFIDNMYGPVGVLLGTAIGAIHTLHGDEDKIAEVVPADYVINNIIAAAWHVGTTQLHNYQHLANEEPCHGDIPIFNYVSSVQNPTKWSE